jgi:uncharacterized membrane protein
MEAMRHMLRRRGMRQSLQAQALQTPLFVLFVCLSIAVAGLTLTGTHLPAPWGELEGLLFVFAGLSAVAGLGHRLPTQNLIAVGLAIAGLGGLTWLLSARLGFPLGHYQQSEAFGPRVFGLLGWPVPFLWLAIVLGSRGAAKLALRPWRRARPYGWLLLATSTLLVLAQVAALEPFAIKVREYWQWTTPGQAASGWYGLPWGSFAGYAILGLATLLCATPWMIVKRPSPSTTPSHALKLYLCLNALFVCGHAREGLWGALGLTVAVSLVLALAARWSLAQAAASIAEEEPEAEEVALPPVG